MSQKKHKIGTINWFDLTIPNAEEVKDFYSKVVGWKPEALQVDDYNDYVMSSPDGTPISGVCHKKGPNAALPSQWLMYVTIENMEKSLHECEINGGKIISPPKDGGNGMYAVIQDPAGAVMALFEEKIGHTK